MAKVIGFLMKKYGDLSLPVRGLPQNCSVLVFSDFRAIYGHSTAVAAAATDDSLSYYYYTTRTVNTSYYLAGHHYIR